MKIRTPLFLTAAAVLGGCYALATLYLPAFGTFQGTYGKILNSMTLYERHATNVVTAVVFDYRGIDTVGEEFMLFMAVTGVVVLFSSMEHKNVSAAGHEKQSDAVRTFVLGLVDVLSLFSLYIILTGHLSPGGGFQGGVMFASAIALIYLAGTIESFKTVTPKHVMEAIEGAGVGGLVFFGLATLASQLPFFENALPLGQTGQILSAGSLPLLNLFTGLAVMSGIVLLMHEFLREVLQGSEGER